MRKATRILVGLKTREEAVLLTDLACRIGAPGASLFLVHVIELPEITPLDANVPQQEAEAREILRIAQQVASDMGVRVETEIERARSAGEALLQTIDENRTDLLVLGSHRRKTLGEVFFGTTHEMLARKAKCEVLLHVPEAKRRAA